MKSKIYLVALLLLSTCFTSVFYGCQSTSITNVVYAESLSYTYSTISARVNDEITLLDNPVAVEPQDITVDCIFSSSNSNIASVDVLTGYVTCHSVGVVIIYSKAKSNARDYIGDSFVLTVSEALIYPTNFILTEEESMVVGLSQTDARNSIYYLEANCNIAPIVSYSQNNIILYNASTGAITPLALGTTTVFVTVPLNDGTNCTKQFQVTVVNRLIYINVQTTFTVAKNTAFYVPYSIQDNTQETGLYSNQVVTAEIVVGSSLVSINHIYYQSILLITGNQSGTAILKLTSCINNTIWEQIGIVIS